jgi:hypothetical protein
MPGALLVAPNNIIHRTINYGVMRTNWCELCDQRVSTPVFFVFLLPLSQKQHGGVGNLLHLGRILKVLRGVGSGPGFVLPAVVAQIQTLNRPQALRFGATRGRTQLAPCAPNSCRANVWNARSRSN